MNALVGISAHHLEHFNEVVNTISLWKRLGFDLVIVFDRFPEWSDKIDIEKHAVGPGVGLSRDFILKMGVERGYDFVILSDAHIYSIRGNVTLYHGVPKEQFVFGLFTSWVHAYRDFDNIVGIWSAPEVPTTNAPITVWNTKLVKQLIDVNKGYAIMTPGFGLELNEPSLTISVVLGTWMKSLQWSFTHKHKTGKEPEWVGRWDNTQLTLYNVNRCVYKLKFGFPKEVHCPKGYEKLYELAVNVAKEYDLYEKTKELFVKASSVLGVKLI